MPPARFMMGDTGSFALGAGLGVVSMMTNSFLLLRKTAMLKLQISVMVGVRSAMKGVLLMADMVIS